MNYRGMKRSIISIFVSFLLLSALYFFTSLVQAGAFSQVFVRLDRTKQSTPTTGLVCALTPGSDNGVEASVQVAFPTGFTVASAANWTVSTADIPSGATAWPGIGSATGVSGQTVTFPSSNLTTGTLYCFKWTNSNALTTPSTHTSESGVVTTRTGAAATIDTREFALPTTNDQLSVTASVPFAANDFAAAVSTNTAGQPYNQGTEVEVQVDYTSNIAYNTPMTVEAEWSLGTVNGNPSPSIDIVEYVVGSASTAYGGAPPVIDVVNRTITWDIASYPAGETNSVTFKVRTTSNYTGAQEVTFDVDGRVLAQSVQSAQDTLTMTYKYVAVITPTPTPGPTNTPTPGPGPTSSVQATPTPTPTSTPQTTFSFNSIDVRTISADLIRFLVSTSQSSTITVRYGNTPNRLTETLLDKSQRSSHDISISPLAADTAYYFQFEAVNSAGRRIKSDIYLVTTARISQVTAVRKSSIIVVSQNVILLQNSLAKNDTIVIPRNTPFSFRFSFEEQLSVAEMRITVEKRNVLGIFDAYAAPEQNTNGTTIVEISPGVYNGLLKASLATGHYTISLQTRDENGNLGEQNMFDIKVTEPMKVIDSASKKPIQGAYIQLFMFNQTEQDYVPITPDMFPVSDSEFTDQNGEASYVLPNARYMARVSAPGYEKKEIEFIIGENNQEELPTVTLVSTGLNPVSIVTYYGAIIWRECQTAASSLQQIAASNNLFGITAVLTMLSFVLLTILSFGRRLSIPFAHFYHYFHHVVTKSHASTTPSHPSTAKLMKKEFTSVIFEYLLVSSFLLEIFFTAVFGLPKTAPFLVLSALNLVLWILHLVHEDRACQV